MKRKLVISRLFLYKHRFAIGYTFLAIVLIGLIFSLPLLSPHGLSEPEMQSAVTSHNTHFSSLLDGELVNLPYHALQKISISIFGLSLYAVKLPSMILSIILGFLIVSLLNRWFKRNVALLASIMSVLSVPFFFLAGTGTPIIMFVFWPILLLWLGGKVQGIKKEKVAPKPLYALLAAIALVLSLFTPYMIYLAIFILLFVLINPHLRFTIKRLPKVPLVVSILIILGGLGLIGYCVATHTETLTTLLFMEDFSLGHYLANIGDALRVCFTWAGNIEGIFLAPLIGLGSLALAIIGIISTAKGFFASRNVLAICLLIFTLIFTGFNPEFIVLIILPMAILMAHGLRYILEKWYGLFPENPYARVFGIIPIGILMGIIIISDLSHFVYGYRYSPPVANNFHSDLTLVRRNLNDGDTLLVEKDSLEQNFYNILAESKDIKVVTAAPSQYTGHLATLGKWQGTEDLGNLDRIITSPKSDNSDRIYLYTEKVKALTQKEEKNGTENGPNENDQPAP